MFHYARVVHIAYRIEEETFFKESYLGKHPHFAHTFNFPETFQLRSRRTEDIVIPEPVSLCCACNANLNIDVFFF